MTLTITPDGEVPVGELVFRLRKEAVKLGSFRTCRDRLCSSVGVPIEVKQALVDLCTHQEALVESLHKRVADALPRAGT